MIILLVIIARLDHIDLVKQHKTHLLWTVQTQLENNHHLMYAA